jgi:ferredoxin
MSRFGIRRKLKGMLGRDEKPTYITYKVTYVLPDGTDQVVEAEERYSLLMASQALPAPISTGRRAGGTCPDGLCALCRLEVIDPTGLSPLSEREKEALDASIAGRPHEGRPRQPGEPLTPNTRLGCHTRIIGDGGRVQVPALVDYEALRGDEAGT